MLGVILGNMVGSMYEFHPCKTKKFNIYDQRMIKDYYSEIASLDFDDLVKN